MKTRLGQICPNCDMAFPVWIYSLVHDEDGDAIASCKYCDATLEINKSLVVRYTIRLLEKEKGE